MKNIITVLINLVFQAKSSISIDLNLKLTYINIMILVACFKERHFAGWHYFIYIQLLYSKTSRLYVNFMIIVC